MVLFIHMIVEDAPTDPLPPPKKKNLNPCSSLQKILMPIDSPNLFSEVTDARKSSWGSFCRLRRSTFSLTVEIYVVSKLLLTRALHTPSLIQTLTILEIIAKQKICSGGSHFHPLVEDR